jgi:ribonuclease HI
LTTVQFDSGSTQKLGTGGFLVWEPGGVLKQAQGKWYGPLWVTNNEAELAALIDALQWVADNQNSLRVGEGILVLGDSRVVTRFMRHQYRPSRKFVPGVTAAR